MDADLVAWARDAASKGDDLFTLLAIDATASESDIRRAFRRKALQLHPDKAGDAYDPALYERIERARDALISPEARKAYDDGMRAVLQKRAQLDQMSARRRRLVEELEQREEAAKRAKTEVGKAQPDPERDAMLARGRAKAEERRRLMREAEERERERVAREEKEREKEAPAAAGGGDDYDSKIADLERRIEEKRQRKLKKMMATKGETGAEDAKQPSPPALSNLNLSTGAAEADACKQPPADEPAPAEPVQNASVNKFAATMARLKAAQAKRDEEKKRKAEAEAKTAS
ncbi:DnaJ subfamily C member 17 [Podospora aff. communis PSN243]|uniref:DnaJ subfamily C member 17 n=1 Tax=Podospora aff. communis PSN243 TaxID=3040156 RepID=A0AAV9H8Q7_9PEZI|nr:DnaJ subfamily C member 17 [Podospora aff. communis PSN243]